MNKLFNTPFEISLRVLLILEISHQKTGDMITALDFLTVYAKDFSIADVNLHGENTYKFSEFALRRELVYKVLKQLYVSGFINIITTKDGFLYSINQKGLAYCTKLKNDYALSYRHLLKEVLAYLKGKSEREILKLINIKSQLKRGVFL